MSEYPEEISVTPSSGNVFADLDLPDAEELRLKSALVYQIAAEIQRRGLTQGQAAQLLGVDQPEISALLRGRLRGFSVERLLRFLMDLGKDVEIAVKPTAEARGQVTVTAA
jgi:predicted XRE-type DNA-binding protein